MSPSGRSSWSTAGGAGRDRSVLMEVEVDKVRVPVCLHNYINKYTYIYMYIHCACFNER